MSQVTTCHLKVSNRSINSNITNKRGIKQMASEQRDNTGALFRNEKHVDGGKMPLYTGKCMVNGQEMRMAAWLKEMRSGQKFMSIQFSEPQSGNGSGNRGGQQDNEDPF